MKTIPMNRSIIPWFCRMSILWISVFFLSTTAYAGLQDGLIAHYPLDGNAVDAGPNGYDGTISGGILPADDRLGNPGRACSFDGSDDYAETGKFKLPTIFSLSMWVNPKSTAGGRIFLEKRSAGSIPLVTVGFFPDDQNIVGYGVNIGAVSYAAGIATTGWQHLGVVVEKSGAQICRVLFYKNGRLLWSKNHYDPFEDMAAGPLTIGASWQGASGFSGEMDELRIYDRGLSLTEIELLYDPTQGLDLASDGDIDGKDLGFFSESMGKIHWYKDSDGDGYSDGTSLWGPDRPDPTYYSQEELIGISGDCDDFDPRIYPDGTGKGCPPFGACCYTAEDECPPVIRCDDRVSKRVCTTELGGEFYESTLCSALTPEQCPAGSELGACCTTSETGAGVCNDDVLSSACAVSEGIFYPGRPCSDLTAEECPTPAATGACCHPKISYVNESGVFPVQCLDNLTEYKCKLLQGTWSEDRECAALTETECPPYGGCCYHDDSSDTDKCANWMLEESCSKLSGSFHANQQCSELHDVGGCPGAPVVSACCLSENLPSSPVRCIDQRTQAQCDSLGGTWYEPGQGEAPVACADLTLDQCPAVAGTTGACCVTMSSGGSTTSVCNDNVPVSDCSDAGGSFFADRPCSDLTAQECPVPAATGACCHPKISYVNESGVFPVQCLNSLTEYKCKLLQGTWTEGETCAELTDCAPFGGCCYKDSSGITKCANWMLEESCNKLSGSFHANQQCSELFDVGGCPGTPVVSACCLSANQPSSPVRCIDQRTQAQCDSLGGTWYEPGEGEEPVACADLSFDQCPAIAEASGACCVTMSSGGSTTSVCNDNVPISDCSDAGGSFFADRPCSDLTAQECPVPAATGACCHPKISYVNESGVFPVQCLNSLTEYKCTLLQGTWTEGETCAELTDCAPFGGCCYTDSSGITKCANWMLEESCSKLNGSFHANQQCSELFGEAGCPGTPVVSACCLSANQPSSPVRCIDQRTLAQCDSLGGTWYPPEQGDAPVACADLTLDQCPAIAEPTGACCQTTIDGQGLTTAVCNDDMTQSACADNGGNLFADRRCSELTSAECPVPAATGACCHPKISYVNESGVFPVQCLDNLTEYKCKLLQGTWSQDEACADLSEAACPPYGACCYTDATTGTAKCANWMLEEACNKLEGGFTPNRQCSEIQCAAPPTLGACCLNGTGQDQRCLDQTTVEQCKTLGGTWFSEQICAKLTSEQCPPIGACCSLTKLGTYECADFMTSEQCRLLNEGKFYVDLTCESLPEESPCHVPSGVCCFRYGCDETVTTSLQCESSAGNWIQGGTCSDCK